MTIDQRDSRAGADRVPDLLASLRQARPLVGFERTVGDEVQALFDDPENLVAAVRTVVREGGWHVGIGIGEVEAVPETVREGRGPAFVAARQAVDAAKKRPESVAMRAAQESTEICAAEALCRLVASIVAERTAPQREVVEAFEQGVSGREVAASLSVTPQAVSQRRTAARLDLEMSGWQAIAALLGEVR
ncbi:MAG: hypothetical protein Q3979_02570 [Actinomycetaceae bacterium]|nr:hypothetical protein [Actinomycetaceae bacterium]